MAARSVHPARPRCPRGACAGRGRATRRRWRPRAGCTSAGWRDSSARRIVVVAGVGEENVLFNLQPVRRVEGAERDVELAAADPFPEQFRAAIAAEPAPDARRGIVPSQLALALDPVSIRGRRCEDAKRTMLAAALPAMTGRGRRPRT